MRTHKEFMNDVAASERDAEDTVSIAEMNKRLKDLRIKNACSKLRGMLYMAACGVIIGAGVTYLVMSDA